MTIQALSGPLPAAKTTVQRTAERTNASPLTSVRSQQADRVRFGAEDHEHQATIQRELAKLTAEQPTDWKASALRLQDGANLPLRAEFNVNFKKAGLNAVNRDGLNPYLNYRQKLVEAKDTSALKQYDALVDQIMAHAEFRQAPHVLEFSKQIGHLYTKGDFHIPLLTPLFRTIAHLGRAIYFVINPEAKQPYFNQQFKKEMEKSKKINSETLTQVIQKQTQPLNDPSTRYIVAGGIAELVHQQPKLAAKLLNPAKKGEHPLRFVLTEDVQFLDPVQNMTGLHTVSLSKPSLWQQLDQKKINLAQNAFIRTLSSPENLDTLPHMTEQQLNTFRQARTELRAIYKKNDGSFQGLMQSLQNHMITVNGLPPKAFRNDRNFLAVSLDSFKTKPEELCKTPPGQTLYDLYSELLNLDPLKEIPQERRKDTTFESRHQAEPPVSPEPKAAPPTEEPAETA